MELKKIQELIEKNNIKPSDCVMHTQRKLENNGRVRVLVLKNETEAHVEYICPKCGHYDYVRKKWKRPFSIKCKNCGELIRIQKMKTLIKKDIKNNY
ncbi:MAG TPA: hypothetical protein ENF39_00535 [Candidatus Aenigmarchaeota archaeon]|nr:hypothetical protein [Candidatus Aenigmarchaeota archaeon]RLJ05996.1 MAG: hypothetical protein DRP14_00785 [Candidatus Aenigmarchaeota archaeon]HDI06475.1 hypothetical protein [Candidatus Aenigmarchaeota archaeon]